LGEEYIDDIARKNRGPPWKNKHQTCLDAI